MTQALSCQIGCGGISSHRPTPRAEPQVPGALGSRPAPNPQAMNADGCFKVRQSRSAEMAESLLIDAPAIQMQAAARGHIANDREARHQGLVCGGEGQGVVVAVG